MKYNNPRKQFINYAAINFLFYITQSLGGYVTVFLQSIGFNAQQVGVITALNSGVGIFSSPFLGMLSDKIRSVRKVILFALICGASLFVLIPLSSKYDINGLSLLFILIPIATFFRMPVMSLTDNWMLRNSTAEKLNYGALRSFGAFSFASASLALGYILPITGIDFTFYAYAILTVPAIIMIRYVKSGADEQNTNKKALTFKEMQVGQIFKNFYLVSHILFSVFQRIPFQCSMIFLPFLINEIGGDTAQIGIVMGVRAFVEIPMMLLLKPLRQKIPLYYLVIAASFFYMVESILYSYANSFSNIVLVSILHGFGNGLNLTAGTSYVFSLAPDHLKATAQTVLGSMSSIAGILGGLSGGVLITIFGIQKFYFVIGIMIMIALVLYILSFFIGEKVLGIKRPGLSTG